MRKLYQSFLVFFTETFFDRLSYIVCFMDATSCDSYFNEVQEL